MSDIKIVVVNQRSQQRQDHKSQVESKLQQIKITNNLINQINFNSTVNRFEYLQQLFSKQHATFIQKLTKIVNDQKDIIKQMRGVQRQVREIKLPSINYNRIIAQSQELIKVKKDSDKNYKLSQGMLNALTKMEKDVENIKFHKTAPEEPSEPIM